MSAKTTRTLPLLLLCLLPLGACQAPEDVKQAASAPEVDFPNDSKLRITVQDSSTGAPYQAATIRILRVDLHSSSHDRWYLVPIQATNLNLLDLANGTSRI